jgi:DNA-binding PadR family transcriptional regulator
VHEFLRGAVRLHVLHHAAHGPVHGAWLSAELAEHGYRISPGSLYPTLHAMENEGVLSSTRGVVNGRTRRCYTATPAGLAALEEAKGQLLELAREVLGREFR